MQEALCVKCPFSERRKVITALPCMHCPMWEDSPWMSV